MGERVWTKTEFNVPYGAGGAISAIGDSELNIGADNTFENNQAGTGSAISVVGADSLDITSTQFNDGQNVQSTRALTPCGAGMCDPG